MTEEKRPKCFADLRYKCPKNEPYECPYFVKCALIVHYKLTLKISKKFSRGK